MKTQAETNRDKRKQLFEKLNEKFIDKRFRDLMNSLTKIDVPLYKDEESKPTTL